METNKPHFPFTYGDDILNDGQRLSDSVVNKLSDKKTLNYLGSVAIAVFALGSQAAPVKAIPPEYGEAANEILNQAVPGVEPALPDLGQIAGNANFNGRNMPAHNPIPNNLNAVGQGGRVGLHNQQNLGNLNPQHPAAWRLPGPPMSTTGQYINTAAIIGSVGWICLNASWGNPILAYGCIGVVGGLLNVLRKRFF